MWLSAVSLGKKKMSQPRDRITHHCPTQEGEMVPQSSVLNHSEYQSDNMLSIKGHFSRK